MSQVGGKPSIAVVDAKELRRTSITSLLEPWAKAEHLWLTSFSPDQAREALDAITDLRMLIFSVGGDSIAEHENLQQVKVLRALSSKVPLVIISDSDDADESRPHLALKRRASSVAESPPRSHSRPYPLS